VYSVGELSLNTVDRADCTAVFSIDCIQRQLGVAWCARVDILHICVTDVACCARVNILHINICVMGWLRLVGSLKSYVSFAKEPYKRDDILQKRPIILRSLLIVATPYRYWCVDILHINICVTDTAWCARVDSLLQRSMHRRAVSFIGLFCKRDE